MSVRSIESAINSGPRVILDIKPVNKVGVWGKPKGTGKQQSASILATQKKNKRFPANATVYFYHRKCFFILTNKRVQFFRRFVNFTRSAYLFDLEFSQVILIKGFLNKKQEGHSLSTEAIL